VPYHFIDTVAVYFQKSSSEIIFIDDLTPIAPEEMPPSDFFFSKKRRAIVKRETHQKEGAMVKRKRMIYDGQNREDSEFAKEVAGSLGAFATDQSMVCRKFGRETKTEGPIGREIARSDNDYGTRCEK
jgi:hypothetical protein